MVQSIAKDSFTKEEVQNYEDALNSLKYFLLEDNDEIKVEHVDTVYEFLSHSTNTKDKINNYLHIIYKTYRQEK